MCGYHEGYLEKLSSKGKWQRRFFACRNGFWNYYASKAKATAHEPMQTIDLSNVTLSQQKNIMIFAFSDGSDLLSRQVRRRGKDGVAEIATWIRILKFRQRASRSFRVLSRYIKPHPAAWDTKRERVKRAMLAYARIVKKHVDAATGKAGINPDGTTKVVMLSPAKPAGSTIQPNGLPQGWSEVTDEATGGLFFWHDETQTAFWAMHEVLDWDKEFHPAQEAVSVPVNSPAARHAASGGARGGERWAIRLPPTLDPAIVQQVRALEDENARLISIMRQASTSFSALVGSAAAGSGSGSGEWTAAANLAQMSNTAARGTRASLSDGTWAPPQLQSFGGGDAWGSPQQPPSYTSGRDLPDQPPPSTAAELEYAFDGAQPAAAALPAMTPPSLPPPPTVRDSLLTPGMVSQHYGGLAAAFDGLSAGADEGQSSFNLTEEAVTAPAAAPSASVLGMVSHTRTRQLFYPTILPPPRQSLCTHHPSTPSTARAHPSLVPRLFHLFQRHPARPPYRWARASLRKLRVAERPRWSAHSRSHLETLWTSCDQEIAPTRTPRGNCKVNCTQLHRVLSPHLLPARATTSPSKLC